MKTRKRTLELVLLNGATLIEKFLKLKLGALVKSPFDSHQQGSAMQEAELKAPGREIAYLCRAEAAFKGRKPT